MVNPHAIRLASLGNNPAHVQDLAVMWGPMEATLPCHKTVKRSEMTAVWHVLKHALPPLSIWTDHKPIVTGVARGKAWCTSPARAHADLWKQIWQAIEDIGLGEQGVTFHWVKAHRSQEAIDKLRGLDLVIALANRRVDVQAKLGATLDDQKGMAVPRHTAIFSKASEIQWGPHLPC